MQAGDTVLPGVFPQGFEVFHWHGDTIDIPASASLLASGEACETQIFIAGNRIIGLQFHLGTTPDSAIARIENCRDELDGSEFVQDEKQVLTQESRFSRINEVMSSVLERMDTRCT